MSNQTNTNLPDLSTWNRVPVGAKVPAGTPYAYVNQNCVTLRLDGAYVDIDVIHDNTYYTEFPVTPPLPTEEGATILASGNVLPPHTLLTRKNGHWVNRSGAEWSADQIGAWCPVTLGETVVR